MSNLRLQRVNALEQAGVIAIVRADRPDGVVDACQALADGGITALEITMTTPNALEAIEASRKALPESVLVGVGSVTDAETVRLAYDAGAEFVVSPITKPQVIAASNALSLPVAPGALTPTEIQNAWELGADVVKVFPADHFGPKFLKNVLAPLPHLKLTPTGGVTLENIPEWFANGAVAVGVGSNLVNKQLLADKNFKALADLAAQYVARVAEARGS